MIRNLLVAAAVLALASPATAGAYRVPRTASGAPDLNGLWSNTSLTPLQRPAAFDGPTATEDRARAFEVAFPKQFIGDDDPVGAGESEWWEFGDHLLRIGGQLRTSIVVDPADGKIPYSDAGRKLIAARRALNESFDGPEVRPAAERCLMGVGAGGAPMVKTNYNSHYLFVQTPDHLAIWVESYGAARIVRLGAKAHLPPAIRPWMGDSIGRWEGDSLVVETTNFNASEALRFPTPLYISPDARLTERFTRISPTEILYAFRVDDPSMTTRPWRGELVFHTAKGPIFEYACHEGNYALPDVLAGARHEEQAKSGAVPAR